MLHAAVAGEGEGRVGLRRLLGGFSFRITFVMPCVAGVFEYEHGIVFSSIHYDSLLIRSFYLRTAYFFTVENLVHHLTGKDCSIG